MERLKNIIKQKNNIQTTVGVDAHIDPHNKNVVLNNVGADATYRPHFEGITKNKNGITLITLVITVILLLILAVVIVNVIVEPDGAFDKAENATERWNNKITAQDQEIQQLLAKKNEISSGTTDKEDEIVDQEILPTGWDNNKIATIKKETSTIAGVNKERIAPIPTGYVPSEIPGENSIQGGLVIYQGNTPVAGTANSADHINAMENRNQYVWIPVDDINDMVMCKRNGNNKKIDGTSTTGGKTTCELVYDVSTNHITCNVHGYTTSTALTDANIDTTGLAGRLYGEAATTTSTSSPYIYTTNMEFTEASKAAQEFSTTEAYREPDLVTTYDNSNYQLVLKESTIQALTTANELKHQLNNKFIEMAKSVAKYGGFYISRFEASYENNKIISKKNKVVLTAATSASGNYLAGDKWYGLYNKTLNNVEKDASVNSHMIWGCQYDQVIKFLGAEAQEGHTHQTTTQKVTAFEGDQDILNNIYDLEGNNFEWTAQATTTEGRGYRGGRSLIANSRYFYPASHRSDSNPTNTGSSITTRPTLYVAL